MFDHSSEPSPYVPEVFGGMLERDDQSVLGQIIRSVMVGHEATSERADELRVLFDRPHQRRRGAVHGKVE
jgi:hypothetical protein